MLYAGRIQQSYESFVRCMPLYEVSTRSMFESVAHKNPVSAFIPA